MESEREGKKRELERTKTQLKAANDELMKTNELLNADKVLRSKVESEQDSLARYAEKVELLLSKYDRGFASADKTVDIDTSTSGKPIVEWDLVTGFESVSKCISEVSPSLSSKNIANSNRPTPGVRSDTGGVQLSKIEKMSRHIQELLSKNNPESESLPQLPALEQRGPNANKSQFIIVENAAGSLPQLPAREQRGPNDNPCESREETQSTKDAPLSTAKIQSLRCCSGKDSLYEHKRSSHIEKPPQGISNETLANEEPIKRHEATFSSQKPFQCSICEMWFKTAIDKNRHIRESHRQRHREAKFCCFQCNRKFTHKYNLRIHIMTLHVPKSDRPHKCATCGKSFVRKYRLEEHQLVHTLERPHKCSICNKTFAVKDSLRLHNATHSSRKPYQCSICKKAFKTPKDRNRHIREVHGGAEYPCSHCDRKFNNKRNLRRHVSSKHLPAEEKSYTLNVEPAINRFFDIRYKNTDTK